MLNFEKLIEKYTELGYQYKTASSLAGQDVFIYKLFKSKYKDNITLKGGVIMHSISKDKRRTTRDIDLDFIKYSLEDDRIREFIGSLCSGEDGVNIFIKGNIIPLKHQDYNGKRVYVELKDFFGNVLETKIDIGVHKNFNLIQEEYYFDLKSSNEKVKLLINSKEQIIVEKVLSLLRFGKQTTRYKDVFDIYYLISYSIDVKKVVKYFECYVFNNENFEEKNMKDVSDSLREILYSKRIYTNLKLKEYNWLNISVDVIIKKLINFFESI